MMGIYSNTPSLRSLQDDPAEVLLGPNLYSYVANSPITYFDPFGLKSCNKTPCDTPPGYGAGPQDFICTVPLGRFVKGEILQCCMEHDYCYQDMGCNAKSWLLLCGSDACQECNKQVIKCILLSGLPDYPWKIRLPRGGHI